MSTCRRETAPCTWDDARDPQFFRMTAHLLTPQFCLGATVLLASYDDEPASAPSGPTVAPVAVRRRIAPQPVRGPA